MGVGRSTLPKLNPRFHKKSGQLDPPVENSDPKGSWFIGGWHVIRLPTSSQLWKRRADWIDGETDGSHTA